ncbi:A24 family peptidase [Virgisporangium ochraceum]|uniref:Type 4 prepilin-like proteins leader peptide-processing enzyme n=1 Tax=Virgisporangium ochraceum TaxID=65505 RepID=A0A8J3ZVR0_9ACTN|nr:A24 family peptidase [Virgisporangium ochraceum]GIJ70859.1 type 4 prepilin-like proteins leader peptide-processing enzyme [Virgisporangium ochraceum]
MVVYLGVLGAALGSFLDALVWRLHTGGDVVRGRSRCETCGSRLGVRDLVPVVSWIVLCGRCRHCGAPVGAWAPVVEAGLAVAFAVSFLRFTDGTAALVLWLGYLVALAGLAVYDARWGRLPDRVVLPLVAVALVEAVVRQRDPTGTALGVALLGGLHAMLHLASRGRWVGLGDAKLGVFAGIVLGWPGALLALAVATVLGAVVALVGLASGRLARGSRLAFGPFLAVGVATAGVWA